MGKDLDSSRVELRNQPVSAVMTRDVYWVPPETSLLELTSEMRRRRISCALVCQEGVGWVERCETHRGRRSSRWVSLPLDPPYATTTRALRHQTVSRPRPPRGRQ